MLRIPSVRHDLDLLHEPDAEFPVNPLFTKAIKREDILRFRMAGVHDEVRMFRGYDAAARAFSRKAAFPDELRRRDHGNGVGFYGKCGATVLDG